MVRARKRATLTQHKTLLNLFALVFLVGCTQQTMAPIDSPTPNIEFATQIFTITPTSEIAATTISNAFTIHSLCPQITNDASLLADSTGTIVLAGDDISFYNEKYSLDNSQISILLFWDTDSEKGTIYPLPGYGQQFNYYLSSPDRTKLALTEGKTLPMDSEVFVLTAQAQQEASFTLPEDWTLFDWLNDEKLLVRQIRLRGEKLDLVAIDPITGEQEFLPSNFPNLYSFQALVFWKALTIFDPSASFVVYPERKENEIISILWDMRNKKEIARITGLSKWPKWAP